MSDEPTERDVEALAEALLLAMDGDFLPARSEGAAEAWEQGRRHGEQHFISCPDDNPYRAAALRGDA